MKSLLQTIYDNSPHLLSEVKACIARQRKEINSITEYGESALRVASNNGRFDVVKLLLDAGADRSQLQWTPTFYEVAYGDLESIRTSLHTHADLEARDFWYRTPWLLSLQVGDIDKAALLLAGGAHRNAAGRCGKTPMAYCIQRNNVAMLKWLIDQGFDIEATNDFLETPLITAAELGMRDCVKLLLDAGADIHKANNIPSSAIQVASTLDVMNLLVEAGADMNDINEEMHAALVGVEVNGTLTVSRDAYFKGKHRHFGTTNPELMAEPFWLAMIKSGANAWRARATYADTIGLGDQAVWCFERYGRTSNRLADGRIIEIGGEHEDYYDPDFCIYNDVTVFHPDGRIELYGYPEKDFPPTDNHSATLVGEAIYIIGNLGYRATRQIGYTPVYKLDIKSYRIVKLDTTGTNPGWIYKHKATFDGVKTITLTGGECRASEKDYVKNDAVYILNLDMLEWGRQT